MKIIWLISFIIFLFFAILPIESHAAKLGEPCTGSAECPVLPAPDVSRCRYDNSKKQNICVLVSGPDAVFGRIDLPPALNQLGVGSTGISKFLNNLITLIYTISFVVFVFMLLWGGFQWLSSGGEKEAIGEARQRIIHALIGIVILAVAFAIFEVVGTFTGFKFF